MATSLDHFVTANGSRLPDLLSQLYAQVPATVSRYAGRAQHADIDEWISKARAALDPQGEVYWRILDTCVEDHLPDILARVADLTNQQNHCRRTYRSIGLIYRALYQLEYQLTCHPTKHHSNWTCDGPDCWEQVARKMQMWLSANPAQQHRLPRGEVDGSWMGVERRVDDFFLRYMYMVFKEGLHHLNSKAWSKDVLFARQLLPSGGDMIVALLDWRVDETCGSPQYMRRVLGLDHQGIGIKELEPLMKLFVHEKGADIVTTDCTFLPGVDEAYRSLRMKLTDRPEAAALVGQVQSLLQEYLDHIAPHFRPCWTQVQEGLNELQHFDQEKDYFFRQHSLTSAHEFVNGLWLSYTVYEGYSSEGDAFFGTAFAAKLGSRPTNSLKEFKRIIGELARELCFAMSCMFGGQPFDDEEETELWEVLMRTTHVTPGAESEFRDYLRAMDRLSTQPWTEEVAHRRRRNAAG